MGSGRRPGGQRRSYSPTLEMAFQLARIFGVTIDGLFAYPDEP